MRLQNGLWGIVALSTRLVCFGPVEIVQTVQTTLSSLTVVEQTNARILETRLLADTNLDQGAS
jgi:hypothetical protein